MTSAPLLAYVAERTGMRLAGAQERRVQRVLARACQQSGRTATAYLDLLRADRSAFDALVDDLTVGETYFFRERPQLEHLRNTVHSESHDRRGRALRAWSAGCSSGEEAYTLAMLLGTAVTPGGVEVLGTDLSPTALAHAERATYGERALRAVADTERARWFEPGQRRAARVREPVRRSVTFRVGNLLDGPPSGAGYDVVLCRNVLIYLSPEAVARVTCALRDALIPGGWLLTGVADPVLESDGLDKVTTGAGVMYQRSSGRARPTGAVRHRDAPVPAAAPRPGRRPLPTASPHTAHSSHTAPRTSAPRAANAPADHPPEMGTVLAAVEASPLDAELRYRLAVLQLEDGDVTAAAESATAAVFLEPAFVVAHLLLGRLCEALGDDRRAHRCFRTAAALLDELPADRPVPHAGGETAESLARVVGAALTSAPPRRRPAT